MKGSNLVAVLALILSIAAIAMCSVCCFGGKSKGGNVEQVLMENPEIITKAMQKAEEKRREEAMAQFQKAIDANISELNNNPDSPVMGNPNGSVVLVEFFDFSCGYCHRLYPAIKAVIEKNPDLKVVTKELAFVSPVSEYAGKAAIAANLQGKYKAFYDAMFTYDGQFTEVRVDEIAVKVGLNLDQLKADMNSDKVKGIMRANSELAGRIQVSGVPTMVLNGKILQTINEVDIQNAINEAKK